MKKTISVIFGTRPEAITLCPLALALKADPAFDCRVCVTGQHREMLQQVLDVFGVVPDVDLALMQPNQTLAGLTARAMTALDKYLTQEKPDIVMVQGDTTTVLCGALTAFYHHILVAHVEAGLRTGNLWSPWPEEGNRLLTSPLAKWHFCTTENNKNNLLREGVNPNDIYVVGNTVIDALLISKEKIFQEECGDHSTASPAQKRRSVLITGHRRENFGEDCSTDNTREICLEYQQRYPDKIRILWCDYNLYRHPHSAGGGDWERNMAHCRSEFIAICEGDDYWIDPLKLQKQVDIMRKHHNVGLVYSGCKILRDWDSCCENWSKHLPTPGMIDGRLFLAKLCFGADYCARNIEQEFVFTATTLIRSSTYAKAKDKFDILAFAMKIRDVPMWCGLAAISDVYNIADIVSVYRRNEGGLTSTNGLEVELDGLAARYNFASRVFNVQRENLKICFATDYGKIVASYSLGLCKSSRRNLLRNIFKDKTQKSAWLTHRSVFEYLLLCAGIYNKQIYAVFNKFYSCLRPMKLLPEIVSLYRKDMCYETNH